MWITHGRAKPLMDRQVVKVSSLSLFFCLFLWLSTYLPTYLCIHLSLCLSIDLSINLFIYLTIYLFNYVSIIYLLIYLTTYLSFYLYLDRSITIYLSIYLCLSVCLSVYLQAWKRSSSARLPHSVEVDNIKNKASNKTSSFFELDSIKNKALRDFLQNGNFLQVWNFIFMGGQTGYFQGPHKHLALDNLWEFVCGAIWARQETWKFKNGKLSAELTASYHCVLRFL